MSRTYKFEDGRFNNCSNPMEITERFINTRRSIHKSIDRCPFCKEELTEIGRKMYLLINNYTMFPNIMVHIECYDERGDVRACEELTQSYNQYKRMVEENTGIWHRD